MHDIALYLCAGVVVGIGSQVLLAFTVSERIPPSVLLRRIWARPVPWVAAGLVALLTVMAVLQVAHPAIIDDLQREPGGGWWRCVTGLLVQTSGWVQLLGNLAALIVVAPVAERVLGSVTTLAVYLIAGVAAQAVSVAGWSPHGGGDSVAICGLVGALSVLYALRGNQRDAGDERDGDAHAQRLRRLALLVPVAAVVLLVLTNNHGVGLAVGCLLGVPLARTRAHAVRRTGF
ncbi:rhomboid family intramembrane serine protease [Actinoplanes sp. HUAS TT8]|uniref:rhomboid family intramembrane serine protease n=1 Tax=Actinoplanes sp. HUAS TT8 TaxID=3447453 RepID=UPI003F522028